MSAMYNRAAIEEKVNDTFAVPLTKAEKEKKPKQSDFHFKAS